MKNTNNEKQTIPEYYTIRNISKIPTQKNKEFEIAFYTLRKWINGVELTESDYDILSQYDLPGLAYNLASCVLLPAELFGENDLQTLTNSITYYFEKRGIYQNKPKFEKIINELNIILKRIRSSKKTTRKKEKL